MESLSVFQLCIFYNNPRLLGEAENQYTKTTVIAIVAANLLPRQSLMFIHSSKLSATDSYVFSFNRKIEKKCLEMR